MQDTRIFSWADVIANRASGYERVDGGYRNGAWESESLMSTADGGIVSTVVDFAKWDAALYTDKILSKRSRDSLWTPVKLNSGSTYAYGLGWNLSAAKRHRVYWHSGGGSGFSSNISRYVDDALTFIILTNLDETATDVVKVAAKVASIYLPETQGANPVKN
jgi:CubicO group peptidase (beta-lactamase class C family)